MRRPLYRRWFDDGPAVGETWPWWSNPGLFGLLVTTPAVAIILLLLATSASSGSLQLLYRARIFLNWSDAFYALIAPILVSVVALFSAQSTFPQRSNRRRQWRWGPLELLFWITAASYAIWLGPSILFHPTLLLQAASAQQGATGQVRSEAATLPGVTSFSQVGVSFVAIFAIEVIARRRKAPRHLWVFLGIIVAFGVLRALVYSERTAMTELLVPLLLGVAARFARGKWGRMIVPFGPYLGISLLPLIFVAFEINRSWVAHYSAVYTSIIQFGIDRVEAYYITAINNGIGFLQFSPGPTMDGQFTFAWLYRMPFVGPSLLRFIRHEAVSDDYLSYLSSSENEQYTNPSSIFPPVHDFGYLGALLVFIILGIVAGRAYRSLRRNEGALQYVLPLIIYHLFEFPRFGYLYDSRAFLAIIGIGFFGLVTRDQTTRSQSRRSKVTRRRERKLVL